MLVTLISKKEIFSITLPSKKEGQYWIKNLISIEGITNQWVLKSNRKFSIIDYTAGKQEVYSMPIEEMQIYHIRYKENEENLIIFTEPITEDRQKYQKLTIIKDAKIPIGRNDVNQIAFKNRFVSSKHAELIYQNKNWYIQDLDSTNGTFVNNKRIKEMPLNLGDVIYIMGFKIVIGIDFIAFNNPDGNVKINSSSFKNYEPRKYKQFLDDMDYYEDEEIEEEYFYRSPRFKREIETADFNIASAPQGYKTDQDAPALLTYGPSIAMGMGSMLSFVTSLATFQIPAAISSAGMLFGSMIMPRQTRKYQKKIMEEQENLRQVKYTEYLKMIENKIDEETARQKEILEENFISTNQCVQRISNVDRALWDRSPDQDDFLKLRVGKGETRLNANVCYTQKDFDMNTDNLDDLMRVLAEKPKIIKDVPIIVSFLQAYMSGIIGNRKEVVAFTKGLILQMMTYYSYDEVKFIFIYDENEEEEFEFVKWLPHTWNNQKTFRFVATNENEVKEISAYIEKEINIRRELQCEELKEQMPYYVIFALSKDLCLRSNLLKRITGIKQNINMSLMTFFDEIKYIPKECSTVIELNGNDSVIYNKQDITGKHLNFIPDILIWDDLTELSTKLANIKLDLDFEGEGYSLPTMIPFLEMYEVGKVEHLNSLTRWKENDPVRSLEAPIGINTYGNIFYLDLHEGFHGPHGIIAGTTGSGKSEFIITYILSMAINYSPKEVSFVLIDYKGGGMAKVFEDLPHTAGIITNLEDSEINRMLVALESEIKRREKIFAEISKKVEDANFDIYKYQKLYREGKVIEPISHLLIIVDEFAELKLEQPEVITKFISISRIGRSLGVHLILATQKPSGVIDDNIRSNAKSRICLKVQDKIDSIDMLKRPEAAEIKETGRFYLQVGNNEIFDLGQSAWSGATYEPQEKMSKRKDDSIQIVDNVGRILKEVKPNKKNHLGQNYGKQIIAITKYIKKLADEENVRAMKIWLPRISDEIFLNELENRYGHQIDDTQIAPLIGEYDDPAHQRHMPLYLPLSTEGNFALFGMTGSGTTMFLTTTIYSIIKNYSSEFVGLYILDFDAETLGMFKNAPHIGDVVFSNEREKIENLFKLLIEQIEQRKKILVEFGGKIDEYNKEVKNKIQKLFIIIHNYEAFKGLYEEYEELLRTLTREATRYGIYFIITASNTNGVHYKVLQNFKQQIELGIKSKYGGRGIIELDNKYEFQVAKVTNENNETKFIKEFCESLQEKNTFKTKKIPILPTVVDMEVIKENLKEIDEEIPIGVDTESLDIYGYDFSKLLINLILSRDYDVYNNFISSLISLYTETLHNDTYVLDINNNLKISKKCKKACYLDEMNDIIMQINKETARRYNLCKANSEKGENIPKFDKMVIFIDSIADLIGMLDTNLNNKLEEILTLTQTKFNITIILSEVNKNISKISFNKWYKENVNNNNGIWIGSGITEQYNLNIVSQNYEMRKEVGNEFGYAIKNGRPTKIKLINLGV